MRPKQFLLAVWISLLLLLMGTYSCEKYETEDAVGPVFDSEQVFMEPNPDPATLGPLPKATVQLMDIPQDALVQLRNGMEHTLLPTPLEATMKAGESMTEHKTGTIYGAPPQGDIMFCMDLTGSMGGELANMKVEACNVMTAIRGLIPNSRFGLISHMDYAGSYASCGYSGYYGAGSDYPFNMDWGLTTECTDVATAITGLSLGNGADFPEDYARAFHEAVVFPGEDTEPDNDWRPGAKKIVIAWLDAVPHDCNYDAIIGGAGTTGADPGRDGVIGTSDDLEILDVLTEMNNANVTLIVLYSGGTGYFDLWQAYTAETGGSAFQINEDGTIPGGIDLPPFIAEKIEAEVAHIDELTLEVITTGFESWLTQVTPVPAPHTDIDLVSEQANEFKFDIEITVPAGTPDGDYDFQIALVGDGVQYAVQNVHITVLNEIEVPIDIHPGGCPNPINTTAKGLLPVAILGTADFDVTEIDPETILLEGLAPLRWNLEDVGTPQEPFVGKPLDQMACNEDGADGLMDLTLKFSYPELMAAIGASMIKGEVYVLHLTGELLDGTSIVGEDVVIVVK